MDDFAAISTYESPENLLAHAREQHRRGDLAGAKQRLIACLSHMETPDRVSARAAEHLAAVYRELEQPREALTVAWYRQDSASQERWAPSASPSDRARTFAKIAKDGDSRAQSRLPPLIAALEEEGRHVHAAVLSEVAHDFRRARSLWERLFEQLDGVGDSYGAGLSQYNVARACWSLSETADARSSVIIAVNRLEQAADRFETNGQRERAFDCYQVLASIGRQSGVFEHVLEGTANAVRILAGDHLVRHATELLSDAMASAEAAGEHAAGAMLARNLRELLRGLDREGDHAAAAVHEAEFWKRAADLHESRHAPAAVVEHALLASLLALAEARQFRSMGELYARLAAMDVEPAKSKRYARSAKRHSDERNRPLPSRLIYRKVSSDVELPDVWIDDLMEWESGSDAVEACASVLLGSDSHLARRAALIARLAALSAANAPADAHAAARETVARLLGHVESYATLAPLERLASDTSPAVRRAALRALSRHYFKRTFVTLGTAITDSDRDVRTEAVAAIERLRFEHAVEPLVRLYRGAPSAEARIAALRALARIDVDESAEVALNALLYGTPEEAQSVEAALTVARGAHFMRVAKRELPSVPETARQRLERVLSARGALRG